ncbi:hypothetical protein [Undibacterium sp.]|uniref:hypothetical protein n=1 Tax=Undibacterium sp. TaxID=1914977 RepID=UPI0037539398
MSNHKPKIGDLRVWHIPQIPGKAFHVAVTTPQEAKKIMSALVNYDLFQFKNRIKPDYSNAQGLEAYEADAGDGKPDWCEWSSEDGQELDEWLEDQYSNKVES